MSSASHVPSRGRAEIEGRDEALAQAGSVGQRLLLQVQDVTSALEEEKAERKRLEVVFGTEDANSGALEEKLRVVSAAYEGVLSELQEKTESLDALRRQSERIADDIKAHRAILSQHELLKEELQEVSNESMGLEKENTRLNRRVQELEEQAGSGAAFSDKGKGEELSMNQMAELKAALMKIGEALEEEQRKLAAVMKEKQALEETIFRCFALFSVLSSSNHSQCCSSVPEAK